MSKAILGNMYFQHKEPKIVWQSKHLSKFESYTKKDKIKIILRTLGFFFSAIGFLYQMSELLSIYFSGKTSVDNRVERLKHSELPAITVCLPTFVSMNKFAENLLKNSKNQTLKELYARYQRFKNMNINWNDNRTKLEQEKIYKKMFEIYPQIQVPIIDLFTKISLDPLEMVKYETLAFNESDSLNELVQPKILESIVPFSDPRKCFTMFSAFDQNYHKKKFNLISLEIHLKHDNYTFPVKQYLTGDFHIALHSPNTLPNYIREETFKQLKIGKINVLSYSEIVTHRLRAPYDTNCKDYKLDYKGEHNMRSDCIQKCIDENLLKEFPEIQCLFTNSNYKLIRKDNLFNLSRYSLCNSNSFGKDLNSKMADRQILLQTYCDQMCLKNCQETFYNFAMDVVKVHSYLKSNDEFTIQLQHNRFPDQIITYKPIMSWIELVSDFGGLLGVWLGLSIAFLLQFFINFI